MKIRNLLVSIFLMGALNSSAQTMEWYSLWGSSTAESHIQAKKMVVDSKGNIYVAAGFCGNAVMVGDKLLSSNQTEDLGDAVLVKMKSDNTIEWTLPFSAAGQVAITDVAVDGKDNIIVAGTFTGTLNPGGNGAMEFEAGAAGNYTVNGFICRINKDGSLLNQWQIPAVTMSSIRISPDMDDNIFVAGTYGNSIQFGNENKGIAETENQLFLIQYSPEGNVLWSKVMEDNTVSISNVVVKVDDTGEFYVAGTFAGNYQFAGTQLTSAGGNDMFLTKYDVSGNEDWAKRLGGTADEEVVDLAISPLGDVAVGGTFISNEMTVSGAPSAFTYPNRKTSTYPHLAVTTFTKTGNYRWQYWYGYANTAEAVIESLECTDEGIYYIGGYCSGRAGDISSTSANAGCLFADGQHFNHNTNGGADAIYLVLSPEGKLCNYARPGGQQTEKMKSVALSPDKKNVYFLLDLCVRKAAANIPVDNLYISYTDIAKNNKTGDFAMITVPCPEAPDANGNYTYGKAFYSICVTRNKLPEINPVELADYTGGVAYSQQLSMESHEGNALFLPLNLPETFNLENGLLSATPIGNGNYSITVISSDDVGQYSYFAKYALDNATTTRGNSRNVRNFILKSVLTKSGSSTDVVFTGNWNEEVFSIYGLEYTKMTTLDFTETQGISTLPVMANLNPNCLIYVNKKHKISGENIVSFIDGISTGTAGNIVLTDNHDFNNTKEFVANNAGYTRDFSEMNGWASVCIPFAADVTGLDIRKFSSTEETIDGGNETVTTVKFTMAEAFEATTPYIMKVDVATGIKTFEGKTPVVFPVTALNPVENDGILFRGNLRKIEEGDATGLYLLNTDGSDFGAAGNASYVPAFRGYITTTGLNRKSILVDTGDGGTTSVKNINEETGFYCYPADGALIIETEKNSSATILTVDGRIVTTVVLNAGTNKIPDLEKGIYIINNRKVVLY